MTKLFVADTNILVDSIEALQDYKIVLLSHTLRELENHKSSRDEELKYKARKVSRYIKEHREQFHFDARDYDGSTLGHDYSNDYQDNNILAACVQNEYGLITNDVLLGYKADGFGLDVVSFNDLEKKEDDYTGYVTLSLSDEEIANLYENMEINYFKLLTNQYVIIKNHQNETIDRLRWDGNKHVKLKFPKTNKKNSIKPKNDEQACAIDLLYNKDVPIKIISGTYGSGKTYLAVKLSLHHVQEDGTHSKIMVIRNPIGSGESIGWLKGDKDDKTQDFFKPFVQHLSGGEQEADILEANGTLIKEIPYYIKGLSIDDTFVVVDEAEDLDYKLIKLIGTRLGENSSIVFCGDFKQAENKFINDNGLKKSIDKLKGNPLVGVVVMSEDVRSEASRVFADL
ncbi:hypothetical protein COE51_16470 [Bacillus pseudomycoides]|nr:hypothetical protein COE51_16470 [Bacillus pseudomycoides]